MVELTAIGKERDDGISVVPSDQHIPYLRQWVRDYVDKRSVVDGMVVLKAEVDLEESNVEALTINSSCVSSRTEHEAEVSNNLQIKEL